MAENEILTLHHVGVAVADISSSARFYVNHFGYSVASPVIHDPMQTAFVQFLRLTGDSSFLELVAPDGPESKLASAVKRGGGLNHLCYRVANIHRAMEQLRSTEMVPLCAPIEAVAFPGRRIAWLWSSNKVPIELVENGEPGEL